MPCFVKDFLIMWNYVLSAEWPWFCARACKAWNVYCLNCLNYVNDRFQPKQPFLNETSHFLFDQSVFYLNVQFFQPNDRFKTDWPVLELNVLFWTKWPVLELNVPFWTKWPIFELNVLFWTEWPVLNISGPFSIE